MRKTVLFFLSVLMILSLLPASALAAKSAPKTGAPKTSAPATASVSPGATQSPQPSAFTVLKIDSSSPDVTMLQMRLRDLGFFNFRATGSFGSLTRDAVIKFQVQNKLSSDGDVGETTFEKLFLTNLVRAPLATGTQVASGPEDNGKTKQYGAPSDWFSVVSVAFKKGTTAKITDFNSGITFNMKRVGGDNHAEVETVTRDDTKNFLKAFGGAFTYEKRAVLVTVDNTTYAGSLFGWPHGDDSISASNMGGHTCLYFSGSYSDVFGFEDVEHTAMVKRASQK